MSLTIIFFSFYYNYKNKLKNETSENDTKTIKLLYGE